MNMTSTAATTTQIVFAAMTPGARASWTTKVSSAFGGKRDSKPRPRYSCVIPRWRPWPTASTTVTPTCPVCSSTASITISTRSRSTTASTLTISPPPRFVVRGTPRPATSRACARSARAFRPRGSRTAAATRGSARSPGRRRSRASRSLPAPSSRSGPPAAPCRLPRLEPPRPRRRSPRPPPRSSTGTRPARARSSRRCARRARPRAGARPGAPHPRPPRTAPRSRRSQRRSGSLHRRSARPPASRQTGGRAAPRLRRECVLDQRLRGDRLDRLQDAAGDPVRIGHRVRPAIFEITAVAAVHEAVRDADRRPAVGDAVREVADGRRFVKAGQAQVVLGAVAGDVLVARLRERAHQRGEVLLAADLAHVLRREVRVQPRAVPVDVDAERLRMEVDVDAVALAETEHQVPRDPELVGGALRALTEDLELPLPLRDFGVDALDPDAGRDAEVDVLVDDLPRDVAHVLEADAGVVLALRRGKALLREPERRAVLVQEVLLLETEPGVGVVCDRGAAVGRMRRAVGQQHLAHDEVGEVARGVGQEGDRPEEAVRVRAVRLAGRAAVEVPQRQLVEGRLRVEVDDLRLAAQVRNGLVTVEPDVLELELHPGSSSSRTNKKGPTTRWS